MKPFFSRKPFLTLLILVATIVAHPAQARQEVIIGTVIWIGYSPLYVAHELDLFEPYGVEVDLIIYSDNTMMTKALKDGTAQAGTLTYDEVIRAIAAEGLKIKTVMPIDYSNGGDALVANETIKSVTDLKGKKVGFNFLAPPDILMAYALQQHGMTQDDIEPLNIPADAIPGAMESARIVAGATYEPNVSILLDMVGGHRYHVIFSSEEAPGLITDTLAFTDAFIRQHPDAVKGVIQGYLDGLQYIKDHPKESARIISMTMGVRMGSVPEEMKTVYNPTLEEMPEVFGKSDKISSFYNSGELIGNLLVEKKAIKAIPPIPETFDARFVQALLREKK